MPFPFPLGKNTDDKETVGFWGACGFVHCWRRVAVRWGDVCAHTATAHVKHTRVLRRRIQYLLWPRSFKVHFIHRPSCLRGPPRFNTTDKTLNLYLLPLCNQHTVGHFPDVHTAVRGARNPWVCLITPEPRQRSMSHVLLVEWSLFIHTC